MRGVGTAGWLLSAACGFRDGSSGSTSADYTLESPAPAVDYEYDAMGNRTRVARESGATTYAWDALDRATQATDPLLGQTLASWTASDALSSVTDPRGNLTGYDRDGLGQLTRLSSPDSGGTTTTYDEAGNVSTRVDARGVTTIFRYDALNRVERVSHQRAGEAEALFTFSYDDVGSEGLLSATTFPEGSRGFAYDAEGQLLSETQQVGGVTTVTRYAYDASGHVVSLTYPSGRRLDVTWKDGVPSALAVTTGEVSTPILSGIVVDPTGALARWDWHLDAGPRPHELERDRWGRLVRYPIGAGFRELGYDKSDRIEQYKHVDASGDALPELDERFRYDALDRLVGYTRRGESHEVVYDAAGNRVVQGTKTWTPDERSNRLVSASVGVDVVRTFVYDANGSVAGDGDLTATYDVTGRMVSLERGGTSTRYAYDAAGRRVRKTNDKLDLHFVYDRMGHLLGEYDAQGAPVREYVWLGDTLVAFYAGTELLFVQSDHLDAPRVAFDTRGQERWRWLSAPFGEDAPEVNQSGLGGVELPLRFPGQYADTESGLHHNRYRDYEPSTGRYLQSDPIGLDGGLNTYAYVGANPVQYVDPDGLVPGDKTFGINDKGFWKWWEQNKYGYGPFDKSHDGFDPKKPFDIPNKEMAETYREEYEQCKQRDGGRGNKTRGSRTRLPRMPRGGGRGE